MNFASTFALGASTVESLPQMAEGSQSSNRVPGASLGSSPPTTTIFQKPKIRPVWFRSFVLCLVALGFANQLYPATVVLSNGDRLTGKISKLEKGKLAVKTDYAGTVQIDWAMVRAFDTDQQFEILTLSGRRYKGMLRRSADALEIITDAERASIPPVDVTGLAPLSDGEPPSFWERVEGAIDAGYSFTRGNSDLTQSSLGLRSDYVREKYKAHLTASSIFSRQNDAPSTSRHTVNGRLDRFLGPRALAFFIGGLERNDRQQLNLRTTTGGGLGWRLVKNKNTELSIRGGLTFTNERFIDGVELSSGEGLGQIEWKTSRFGKVKLSTDARFYPSVTESGRYRIEYDSTMRVPVLSQLTWSLSLFDRFDSAPPQPIQRNDYGLVSAFGFTF
jgi:hypothetical protein